VWAQGRCSIRRVHLRTNRVAPGSWRRAQSSLQHARAPLGQHTPAGSSRGQGPARRSVWPAVCGAMCAGGWGGSRVCAAGSKFMQRVAYLSLYMALSSFDLRRYDRRQLWSCVFRGGWPLWAMCIQRSKPTQPAPLCSGATRPAGAAPDLHNVKQCCQLRILLLGAHASVRMLGPANARQSSRPGSLGIQIRLGSHSSMVLTGIPFHQLERLGFLAHALVSCTYIMCIADAL